MVAAYAPWTEEQGLLGLPTKGTLRKRPGEEAPRALYKAVGKRRSLRGCRRAGGLQMRAETLHPAASAPPLRTEPRATWSAVRPQREARK